MTIRVLIAGSLTWPRAAAVTAALDALLAEHGGRLVVMHGAAEHGADAIADAWCRAHGVAVERWPADWSIGPHASHARYAAMVSSEPALCLAFIDDRDRTSAMQARDCAALAREAEIPTIRRWHHSRPATIAAAVRALRPGTRMCTAGCGWPVDPATGSDRHPTCQPDSQAEEIVSDLLAPALQYAEQGWPVFMLGRSKRPVANCGPCRAAADGHDPVACTCLTCHGFYAASADPLRVAGIVDAVPGGQLALRTGTASGVVVVDVDPRHGGDDTMTALIRAGLLPPTLHVVTGSGGRHLYYRHPGRPVRCSQGKPGVGLGPGIDVKADGGYVVLPPSVHPRTGRPYRWVPGRRVEEMPPALVEACDPPPPAPAPTTPAGPITTHAAGGISHPDRLLAAHLHAVASAPEGARRTTLYGAARGVARMVAAHAIDQADAVAALTDAGRQAEQTDRDIRAAIHGGFRAEGVAA